MYIRRSQGGSAKPDLLLRSYMVGRVLLRPEPVDKPEHLHLSISRKLSNQWGTPHIILLVIYLSMDRIARYAGCSNLFDKCIEMVVKAEPDIIIDDGGDILNMLHNKYPELEKKVIGGGEETTTGIIRLKAMEKDGELKFPMFNVNDANCKHLFDNRYGTGQSVFDGINGTTNLIIAGKHVVVAGYGWCGRGTAMRAKGLGAKVIVTEINPVKAIEAVMDGFEVMPMAEAAKIGDVFVTTTGCNQVITEDHFYTMKDGVLLSNAGHFNVEVDVKRLEEIAVESRQMKPNIMGYKLSNGNWLYVLGEGRLVNLAAEEIDDMVARMKLESMGITIDVLTPEQEKYLSSWQI